MDAPSNAFSLLDQVDTVLAWVERKADAPGTDLEMLQEARAQLDDYVTRIIRVDEDLARLPQDPKVLTLRAESRRVVALILSLRFGGRVPPVER